MAWENWNKQENLSCLPIVLCNIYIYMKLDQIKQFKLHRQQFSGAVHLCHQSESASEAATKESVPSSLFLILFISVVNSLRWLGRKTLQKCWNPNSKPIYSHCHVADTGAAWQDSLFCSLRCSQCVYCLSAVCVSVHVALWVCSEWWPQLCVCCEFSRDWALQGYCCVVSGIWYLHF